MPDASWTKVIRLAALKEGAPRVVETPDGDVMLVRLDGRVHACGSMCTHYGGPLDKGVLEGKTVVCPWHAYDFDLRTGECGVNPDLHAVTFPVTVEAGDVFVDLP